MIGVADVDPFVRTRQSVYPGNRWRVTLGAVDRERAGDALLKRHDSRLPSVSDVGLESPDSENLVPASALDHPVLASGE